jgi:hypothetical protein
MQTALEKALLYGLSPIKSYSANTTGLFPSLDSSRKHASTDLKEWILKHF